MPINSIDDDEASTECWCERCQTTHHDPTPERPQTTYVYAVGQEVVLRRGIPDASGKPPGGAQTAEVSRPLSPRNRIPIYWVMVHTALGDDRFRLTIVEAAETGPRPVAVPWASETPGD
jgi:hypothetical protein